MSRLRAIVLFMIDLVLTISGFAFCFYITRQYDTVTAVDFLKSLLLLSIVYPVFLLIFGVYQSLWRYAQSREFLSCLIASLLSGAVYFTLSRLLIPNAIPAYFYVFTAVTITIELFSLRLVYRFYRSYNHHHAAVKDTGHSVKSYRTLIIGAGDACRILLEEIRSNPNSNIQPVVICDNNSEKTGKKIYGIKIISPKNGYPSICKEYQIEQIIIAIPSADNQRRAEIIEECSKTNCSVKMVPRLSEMSGKNTVLHDIRDITMEELLGREPIRLTNEQLLSTICGKTVMVTGGGGSIGSELCRQIAAHQPKKLIIVDIYENNAYDIQQELVRKYGNKLDLVVLIGSVRDKSWIHKTIHRYCPDVLLHAAAHKHVPLMEVSPAEAVKNNIFGTFNTACAAGDAGVKRFILISTDKAVNPTNIMGATKRVCELIIHSMCSLYPNTGFAAVRFGNVLGSNGSVIPLFRKQIMEGGPVTVTHPDIIRYFMTIPEAAQLVLLTSIYGKGGEVFVLDMGEPVRIDDLARKMICLSGLVPDKDIKLEYSGLRPGEKLYEELLMAEEGLRPTENKKIYIGKQPQVDSDVLYGTLKKLQETIALMDKNEKIPQEECNELVERVLETLVPTFNHTKSDPSNHYTEGAEVKAKAPHAAPVQETVTVTA